MLKKILLGILNFIFRTTVAVAVVLFVYRLAMYSYHFGYMVFADAAVEPSPGRDIIVTVDSTENIMDVGRLLKSRGLITDEKVFMVQERLSDYHGKLVPGTYTLNTSMKVGTMLQIMGEQYEEEEEEGEDEENKEGQNTAGQSEQSDGGNEGYYDPMTGDFHPADEMNPQQTENADSLQEGQDAEEGTGTQSEENAEGGDKPAGGFGAGAGL